MNDELSDLVPEEEIPEADESVERVTEEEATPPVVKRRRKSRAKKAKAVARAIEYIAPGRRIVAVPGGRRYVWDAPGAVVQVAAEDVDRIMGANRSGTRACCGAGTEKIYFVFAD